MISNKIGNNKTKTLERTSKFIPPVMNNINTKKSNTNKKNIPKIKNIVGF